MLSVCQHVFVEEVEQLVMGVMISDTFCDCSCGPVTAIHVSCNNNMLVPLRVDYGDTLTQFLKWFGS